MLFALFLPFAAVLAPPAAPAVAPAAAPFDFAPIDERIERLDYEEARELLLIALARPNLTENTRRDLHLRAGIVDRVLNHDDESKMHFQEALSLDGDADLPPGESPKIVTYFQLVKSDFFRNAANAAPVVPTAPAFASDESEPGLPMGGMMIGGAGAAILFALAPLSAAGAAASYVLMVDNRDAAASQRTTGRAAWIGLSAAAGLSALVGAVVLASGAGMVLFAD